MKSIRRFTQMIALLAMAGMAIATQAQTTAAGGTPALPPPFPDTTLTVASGTQGSNITSRAGVWADLKQLGGDAWSGLKDLNFNNGVRTEPFGLLHDSDYGGGLAITTANTNGINAGFAVAAITEKKTSAKTGKTTRGFDFYDATLSLQLGKAFTVPVLNLPAYTYVEFGPALNLAHPNTILEQSVGGFKLFFLNGKLDFGAGVGQNSEWGTPFYILHGSYTF